MQNLFLYGLLFYISHLKPFSYTFKAAHLSSISVSMYDFGRLLRHCRVIHMILHFCFGFTFLNTTAKQNQEPVTTWS